MQITISTEVATLSSGIIGGIIGSLGNYLVQRRKETRQEHSEMVSLRSSLISEIETMNHVEDFELGPRNLPKKGSFSKDVYENSSHKLGLLTDEEASAVIQFYGSVEKLQSHIEAFHIASRQYREIEEDRHAAKQQASTARNKWFSLIETSFYELKKNRRAALNLLNEHAESQ
ncbi:hypothetical protein ACFR9U_17245 [Halorientalis brevis]|uniref:Uncharacterized protein n=1 Tax=Halorientalis brevis TaxID=1126241 RepID=A0ABD6CFJ7_9EURY|nr:hypothetical protein [Halorientalis brevis]